MRDFIAVELTGAVKSPKARVLYQDGIIKAFNKQGLIATLKGTNPEKRSGWRLSWVSETDKGTLYMQGRCIACGGWLKVARMNKETLWAGKQKH